MKLSDKERTCLKTESEFLEGVQKEILASIAAAQERLEVVNTLHGVILKLQEADDAPPDPMGEAKII